MPLYSLSLNHHAAPLPLRERVFISPDALPKALRELVTTHSINEAAILSTCNRTEIYCQTQRPQDVAQWLAEYQKVPQDELMAHLYVHPQQQAVHHAFRVASGLDSMVLGEPQILGQIKQAARIAKETGTLGTLLHRLFQRTFAVAKEVRSTTKIGAHIVSVAVAAARLSQRIVGDLSQQKFLFIGAGEMIALSLAHFSGQGAKDITIANRTMDRAQTLANRFHARAIPLHQVGQHLAEFDVVVSCTASPLPILGLGMVDEAMRRRRHKIMVMVDLALPRDIEHQVGTRSDIFLYTLDNLSEIVNEGMEQRQAAAAAAESIVTRRVENFMQWLDSRETLPTVRALREHAEQLRQNAIRQARNRLAKGEDPLQVMEVLSQNLTNKFLHAPTRAIQSIEQGTQPELLTLIEHLYRLPESSDI